MASAGYTRIDYRPDIDGIRAIAVLSVFFYHLYPALLPGGFLGVDVFFVISGYLITYIILRENRLGTFSFSHFYARRIKRIFPALFVVLLLSSLVATVLLPPETYLNFMHSARYAAAQIANLLFARKVGYFGEGFSGQPLLHTWSLGVEEQFYLCWPLLIFFCYRFLKRAGRTPEGHGEPPDRSADQRQSRSGDEGRTRIVFIVFLVLALVSYAVCFILAEVDPQRAFYMFYTRAWEFCLGGIVALPMRQEVTTRVSGSLIGGLGIFLLSYSFFFVEQDYIDMSFLRLGAILPCIGTALLLSPTGRTGAVNRMLARRLPVGIGRISYSLYLYHWPVIIFTKLWSSSHEISGVTALMIVAVSFVFAILSYLFIEQPARRAAMPGGRVLAAALVVIIVFSQGFNYLESQDQAPWRIARYVNEEANPPQRYPSACVKRGKEDMIFADCKVAGKKGAPIIALAGDSHAPHYFHALVSWARTNGYDVRFLAVPACPMLLGEVKIDSMMDDAHETQCAKALPLFAEEMVNDPDVEIVMLAQRFDLFHNGKGFLNSGRQIQFKDENSGAIKDHTGYYRDRLADTVDSIRKAGKEPVILKQVPILGSINACDWEPLAKKWLSRERECAFGTVFIETWQRPSIDFIDEFVETQDLAVLDPFPFFDEPLQDDINIYLNIDHLNVYGYQFLIPHFSGAMDSLMTGIRARKNLAAAKAQ